MNVKLFFTKNSTIRLVVCAVAIFLSATNVLAATGSLDPTFGENGIVTTKPNGVSSSANDVVLQADGKIITLGTVKLNDGQIKKAITRYNNNGTLDTAFGINGSTLIEVASFSGSKIAVQPDGKLIIDGLSGSSFAVVRYNSNGTLDTSFGTNGLGILTLNSDSHGSPTDLAIQPDGRIILVGDDTLGQSNFTDFFIVRFNNNGTPDSSFVANGFNIIDKSYFPNNRYNYGKAVVIQPDGKIVMSGNMLDNDGKNQISLARLNQDGSLDASGFGTNGKGTVTTPANFQNSSGALTLQADGKIVVAGTVFDNVENTSGNLAMVRYNTNGTLDTTFGGTGIVTTDFGSDERADDLVIQAGGKIIIVGNISSSASVSDFLLVRYNSDGSLDTTFGTNGKMTTDFGGAADTAMGIVMQPDSKVIVTGSSGDNAILARFDTNSSNIVQNTLTFKSADAYDGWILESAENSNKGGSLDKISSIINVGDDAKDRQYRGVLSFNTISIPDNAFITSAQIRIKRQGFVGTDAFKTHGDLLLDIRTGTFNNNVALQLEDFSASANTVPSQDKFSESAQNWYTTSLSNINLGLINKFGVTQFRLLFSKDDNDDMGADYIKFFSGNAETSNQPQLIIIYSTNTVDVSPSSLSAVISSEVTVSNRPPVITSNGGVITADINIPENTTAVTTVSATDADLSAQPITYSIPSGSDSAMFSITADTGILTFVSAPNFESIPSGTIYHVTVQASDGNQTVAQNIAVTVVGVNEYAPEIKSNGGDIYLPENTTTVTMVTATDADLPSQPLTYSIIGGADSTLFNINSSTGELTFITGPDFEIPKDVGADNIYNLTVQVSDGTYNSTQNISIRLTKTTP